MPDTAITQKCFRYSILRVILSVPEIIAGVYVIHATELCMAATFWIGNWNCFHLVEKEQNPREKKAKSG